MKRSCMRLAMACGTLLITLGAFGSARGDEPGPDYSRPLDASLDGFRSDSSFHFVTIAISILFLIMAGVLVFTMTVQRERPGRKAKYEHGMGKRHLFMTAALASVIFFGVDGTALYHSYFDITEGFFKFPTAAEDPIEIEVFGQQWAWNVRYPGPDKKFNTADDIVTLNDVHVPMGKPVLLKLKSKDVVHSFYLPNFRTKQDVFPAAVSKLWFQATKTGEFEIGCAQHCGANHYKMHGMLTVTSPEEFAAWQKTESAASQRRYDEADTDAHWGWDWEI